jgi:hypothetical protein
LVGRPLLGVGDGDREISHVPSSRAAFKSVLKAPRPNVADGDAGDARPAD